MIPLRLYLGAAFIAACAGLAVYVSYLEDSLTGARLEASVAAERASRLETVGAANTEASETLLASNTKTRVVTKEIIREVLVRIPGDACPLPVDWRLLHDAAAAGQAPSAPAGPDGPASGTEAAPR